MGTSTMGRNTSIKTEECKHKNKIRGRKSEWEYRRQLTGVSGIDGHANNGWEQATTKRQKQSTKKQAKLGKDKRKAEASTEEARHNIFSHSFIVGTDIRQHAAKGECALNNTFYIFTHMCMFVLGVCLIQVVCVCVYVSWF